LRGRAFSRFQVFVDNICRNVVIWDLKCKARVARNAGSEDVFKIVTSYG